ncbi:SpoVR family protein [Telmatospirillum siberiense]|uniref:SpoVR family protein n=1 Tax=Telmatospirillum siberiense TaxID=382514 RepID=A0A2N3PVV4_9PROT|nr:SpoVR family protein [Telmatospirillum siberiense]PKU24542.1 SpoVR family protein [Telmatospirillum siberiense]
MTLLYEGREWNFDKLRRAYDAVAQIATEDLGLDTYPNQIEVITSTQMLDAYASNGLPILYRHWSFGKRFIHDEALYRKGYQGLAYEIVINSDPCICYIMEENSMTMQTLVLAHAAFGHNHFFKNNNLFRQWTDATAILDYLTFARDFIASCEERHGVEAVEHVLDAAHALQTQGVNRYARHPRRSLAEELAREKERRNYEQTTWNPLWTTVPGNKADEVPAEEAIPDEDRNQPIEFPEENLLYFLEKNSPALRGWEREILRIVRNLSQYFYPQRQTKVMNEGCATFVHYEIMTRLHERRLIDDGAFLEFIHSHSSVAFQPPFTDPRYGGMNPYALGFAVMRDIQRICTDPTGEDRAWFPDMAGNGDPFGTLRDIWAQYRDESFLLQYLSPKVIRDFRMIALRDEAGVPYFEVAAIHDEQGYRDIRAMLARGYECARSDPEIEIVGANLAGDRKLLIENRVHDGQRLSAASARRTLQHIQSLWGYGVRLTEINAQTGKPFADGEFEA